MKPRSLTLATAGALLLPLCAFGQTSSATYPQNTHPQAIGNNPAHQPGASVVTRVDEDQRARVFTARDLIGKSVFNHEGERLGTINDVALSKTWVERFGPPEGVAASSTPSMAARESDLLVYVSTGGVLGLQGRLGVRADWVSVSADNLLFDRHNDRFILNMPHAQFSAIAQGRSGSDVYASNPTSAPATPMPPSRTGGTIGAQTGTSQPGGIGAGSPSAGGIGSTTLPPSSSQDLRRIQDALSNHNELRGRSRIQVSHTGSAIQLSGEVETAELLRRAGDVARQHTNLEVRNYLEIARPFATE